jgi:hypothetical protein
LQLAAAVVAYDVVRPDDGGLAKVKLESLKQGKLERKAHREKILRFIQILNKAGDDSLGDFDENLFRQVVESMTVHALDDIVVRFVSGVDIKVNII